MKKTTWTAGELRKLHGADVEFETSHGDIIKDAKISVNNDGAVYIVSDDRKAKCFTCVGNKLGKKYSWIIYRSRKDEEDERSDNDTYKWINVLNTPTTKPELIQIRKAEYKWSDSDTLYTEDTVTFGGKEYTKDEWNEFYKTILLTNRRVKKIMK